MGKRRSTKMNPAPKMQDKKKDPFRMAFGEHVKSTREKAGLTQEKLAEAVGISVPFLSNVERGVDGVSVETLMKLCDALHTSSDSLLYGTPETSQLPRITHKLNHASEEELLLLERGIDLMTLALRYQQKRTGGTENDTT